MGLYSMAGRSTATASAADQCGFNFWNPSSTKIAWLLEVAYCCTTAPAGNNTARLTRTSTAGTGPSATITPDTDNAWDRDGVPPSAAVLHLGAFATAQPVIEGPAQWRTVAPPSINGLGFEKTYGIPGLAVPPGTGIGIFSLSAIWGAGDVTVIWWEGPRAPVSYR